MKFIGFADEVSPEVAPEAPQEAPHKAPAKSVTPEYVASVAQRYGVDPELAKGHFRVESSSGANTRTSPKGAIGPMQVMPNTFDEVYPGGDIYDDKQNVEAGIRYLAKAQKVLGTNDPRMIAAAYHAGIGAVKKAGGVPNTNDGIMSTSDYVDRVTGSSGPREGLRRISAKKMTFVGFSDEEDPAYSRFNPPKKPVEAVDEKSPSAPISELPGDLWEAAKGLGTSFKSAWAGLVEGGDPENIDYGNAAVKEAKDRALKSAAEPGSKDPYIDFAGIKLTRDQVRTMDQSLAFSVLGMGASITGALIGSLGGPGTALAGATGFGARAAYNMDANSVARQMRDGMDAAAKQQRGEPLTDEEFAAIVKSPDMQDAAKKVGLEWNKRGSAMGEIQTHAAHEALWEGLGNVATMGFGAFIAKEAMKRGIVKPILGAIGMAGGEVLTEWPTQQGQQRAESRLGLTDEPPRQYDKWQDWATSFEEVAGPTLAQVGLTGGGAYVGGRIAGAVSGKPNEAPPTPPPADTEFTPAGLIPERPSSMQMGQMGIREGSRGKTEADVAAEQMYAERDAVEAAQRDLSGQGPQPPADAGGGGGGAVMTNPDLSRDNSYLSGDNSLPVMPGTQELDLGAIAEDSDRAKLAKLRERQMGAIQYSGRDAELRAAEDEARIESLPEMPGTQEEDISGIAQGRANVERRGALSPLQAAYQRAQAKKELKSDNQQVQAEKARRIASGRPVFDLAERARNAMAKFAALSAPVAPVGQVGQQPVAEFAEPAESAPVAQQQQEVAATDTGAGRPGIATPQPPVSFQDQVAQRKERRDSLVSALQERVDSGGGARAVSPDGSSILLTPGLSGEPYRVTSFDKDGNPTGHREYKNIDGGPIDAAVSEFMPSNMKLEDSPASPVSPKNAEQPAAPPVTESQVPDKAKAMETGDAGVASGQEAAGPQFDSESFDKNRADTIAASRAAGNVHLDKVPAYVETMRGKIITYAHDTKERGRIATVDNQGNVYVDWLDEYSRKKELASPTKQGKKTVWLTSLGPSDLKDYVIVNKAATAPAAEQQPQGAENGLQETPEAAEAVKQSGPDAALPSADVGKEDANYYYVDGSLGMKSNGSFTSEKRHWMTFGLIDAKRMADGEIKPYGATRRGLFIGTVSGDRLMSGQESKQASSATDLKNIEVTRRTFETDANGNRRELEGVKEPADKALADVDQQISAIRALIECLNS
jgi:hypothetical protein